MIISDTTPLINFCVIEKLDILQGLFSKIFIPCAVEKELIEKIRIYPSLKHIKQSPFLSTLKIQDVNLYNLLKLDLDEGEAEAITLAIEKKAKLILLDELAARNIAQFHNLNFIGSIGCLVLAKKKGIISFIKPILDLMRTKARFWVNQKLYEKVLRDSGE